MLFKTTGYIPGFGYFIRAPCLTDD
uniref:Uncharacterized protein n=1 Tax=Anguilla anguilla TaxID=7936 RepID=A0A0E9SGJ4_ANGAN